MEPWLALTTHFVKTAELEPIPTQPTRSASTARMATGAASHPPLVNNADPEPWQTTPTTTATIAKPEPIPTQPTRNASTVVLDIGAQVQLPHALSVRRVNSPVRREQISAKSVLTIRSRTKVLPSAVVSRDLSPPQTQQPEN
jgi:hypothetical protein